MKILDASSVICVIHEAKRPEIFDSCLRKGYKLNIPRTVFEELKRNKKTFSFIKENNYFEVIDEINQECFDYFTRRYPYLHSGEIGVICCGFQKQNNMENYICIIDEKPARKLDELKKLRYSGVLGLMYN